MSAEPKRVEELAAVIFEAGWRPAVEVADRIIAAGWVSPEEAKAREVAARREALLEAEAKHGYEVTRLTQERDYWRNGMDRHGPCVCDTNPETTSGPEEHCPHHGRNYAEWVERGDMLQAKVARVEALAEAMHTWSSHRGLAVDYASRIRAALAEPERDEEDGR